MQYKSPQVLQEQGEMQSNVPWQFGMCKHVGMMSVHFSVVTCGHNICEDETVVCVWMCVCVCVFVCAHVLFAYIFYLDEYNNLENSVNICGARSCCNNLPTRSEIIHLLRRIKHVAWLIFLHFSNARLPLVRKLLCCCLLSTSGHVCHNLLSRCAVACHNMLSSCLS